MKDFRGVDINVGDSVAIYFGYNRLEKATVVQIGHNRAKVLVHYKKEDVLSKWKAGECMVKLGA